MNISSGAVLLATVGSFVCRMCYEGVETAENWLFTVITLPIERRNN